MTCDMFSEIFLSPGEANRWWATASCTRS